MTADAGSRRLTLPEARQFLKNFGVAVQGGALHCWRRRGQVAPGVPVEIDAAMRHDAEVRLREGDPVDACQLERTAARLIQRAREAAA